MGFIAQTNVPNYFGLADWEYRKLADEAYREAHRNPAAIKVQKDREEKVSTGYSPILTERTQYVQVTYNDGTQETFEVHNCNTESSPYYKVLNWHRNSRFVQKPIETISMKVDKPVFKQIY